MSWPPPRLCGRWVPGCCPSWGAFWRCQKNVCWPLSFLPQENPCARGASPPETFASLAPRVWKVPAGAFRLGVCRQPSVAVLQRGTEELSLGVRRWESRNTKGSRGEKLGSALGSAPANFSVPCVALPA